MIDGHNETEISFFSGDGVSRLFCLRFLPSCLWLLNLQQAGRVDLSPVILKYNFQWKQSTRQSSFEKHAETLIRHCSLFRRLRSNKKRVAAIEIHQFWNGIAAEGACPVSGTRRSFIQTTTLFYKFLFITIRSH